MTSQVLPDKIDLLLVESQDLDELSDAFDIAEDAELVVVLHECRLSVAGQVKDDAVVVLHVLDHVGPRVLVAAESVQKNKSWLIGSTLAYFGIAPNAFAAAPRDVLDPHA